MAPRLYVWPVSAFDPAIALSGCPAQLPTEVNLAVIDAEILHVLGIVGQSTVLIIDVNLWVYSMELRLTQGTPHARSSFSSGRTMVQNESESITQQMLSVFTRRHFFALSEWRTTSGELRFAIAQRTRSPDFFFASRQYIIVVQGGLEFSEVMTTG